jgi:hypothetical protein
MCKKFVIHEQSEESAVTIVQDICHSERSLRGEESLPDFMSYDQSRFL